MTFDKVNRRTHLYLGLSLLPWFFMYGASSFPLAHKHAPPTWTVRADRPYHLAAFTPDSNLEEIGDNVLKECGISTSGRHGAYRDPKGNLQVYVGRFITPTRVTYNPAKDRIVVEDRNFNLVEVLVEMHVRGGFEKGGFMDHFWSVIVDIVGIATVLWVLSGVYMWWHLTRLRFWGTVAICGGVASFLLFVFFL